MGKVGYTRYMKTKEHSVKTLFIILIYSIVTLVGVSMYGHGYPRAYVMCYIGWTGVLFIFSVLLAYGLRAK